MSLSSRRLPLVRRMRLARAFGLCVGAGPAHPPSAHHTAPQPQRVHGARAQIANASVTRNATYLLPWVGLRTSVKQHYWKEGRCVRGTGFSPLGLERDDSFSTPGFAFNLKITAHRPVPLTPRGGYVKRRSAWIGATDLVVLGAVWHHRPLHGT